MGFVVSFADRSFVFCLRVISLHTPDGGSRFFAKSCCFLVVSSRCFLTFLVFPLSFLRLRAISLGFLGLCLLGLRVISL